MEMTMEEILVLIFDYCKFNTLIKLRLINKSILNTLNSYQRRPFKATPCDYLISIRFFKKVIMDINSIKRWEEIYGYDDLIKTFKNSRKERDIIPYMIDADILAIFIKYYPSMFWSVIYKLHNLTESHIASMLPYISITSDSIAKYIELCYDYKSQLLRNHVVKLDVLAEHYADVISNNRPSKKFFLKVFPNYNKNNANKILPFIDPNKIQFDNFKELIKYSDLNYSYNKILDLLVYDTSYFDQNKRDIMKFIYSKVGNTIFRNYMKDILTHRTMISTHVILYILELYEN